MGNTNIFLEKHFDDKDLSCFARFLSSIPNNKLKKLFISFQNIKCKMKNKLFTFHLTNSLS